jgi:hypothetical protein
MKLCSRWTPVVAVACALTLLSATGCNDDDDGGDPTDPGGSTTVVLHYDNDNVTAPLLAAGTYEAAARFTTADTQGLEDGELIEVRFFIATAADSCVVSVYGDSGSDTPGALLYSDDVTGSVTGGEWNTHTLDDPVPIPDGDLWIAIRFAHAGGQQTIGCDNGPADPNGRWLWDATWTPFAANINWNIRGVVEIPN